MPNAGKILKKLAIFTVLFTIILTVVFSLFLKQFSLDATTDSLVLQKDPDLEYYNSTRDIFGSDEYVIVAFQADDIFSKDNIEFIDLLSKEIQTLQGIEKVVSITTVPLFRSPVDANPLTFINSLKNPTTILSPRCDHDKAKIELLEHEVFKRNIISEDGKTTAMLVFFKKSAELTTLEENLNSAEPGSTIAKELEDELWHAGRLWKKERRARVDSIKTILARHENPQRIFFLSGVPLVVHDMVQFIETDLWWFGTAAIMFISILLYLVFRRLHFAFLPILTCAIVVIWTIAIISIAGNALTVVSSNLAPLLFAIAMAHSIHLLTGYLESSSSYNHSGRIISSLRTLFIPCLYTAITTAVGFASLVICDIQPVKDFGLYMSMGVGFALLISFTFFPAALLLLGKNDIQQTNRVKDSKFLGFLARLTVKHRKSIIAAAIIVTLISIYGIRLVNTETRFIDYFRNGTDVYKGLEFIDKKMGGTTSLEIILKSDKPGYFKKAEAITKLHDIQKSLQKYPEIGKTISLADFNNEFGKYVDRLSDELGPLGSMFDPGSFSTMIIENAPQNMLKPYVDEKFQQARIFIRIRETSPDLNRNNLIRRIKSDIDANNQISELSPRLSGIFILYANMLNSLVHSQIWSFWVVFAAIFVVFLLLFRSFQLAIFAMLPNMIPVAMVLGIMGFSGIHLDMVTIMIASVSLGIGADGAIHYIFRFKKEYALCNSHLKALYRSHNTIGRAIFYTSSTVIAGFWILSFSNFTPTAYFGILTGLSMLAVLAASLVLLPLCLIIFKPLKKQSNK